MQNNTCAMRDATTDFPSPLFCHTKKNVDSWNTTTATQKFIIARFSLVSFLSFFAGKRDECLSHKMFLQGRSTGFSQMRKKESKSILGKQVCASQSALNLPKTTSNIRFRMEHKEKKLLTHADGENVSKADMAPFDPKICRTQNTRKVKKILLYQNRRVRTSSLIQVRCAVHSRSHLFFFFFPGLCECVCGQRSGIIRARTEKKRRQRTTHDFPPSQKNGGRNVFCSWLF